jgi:DNA repair photolyase
MADLERRIETAKKQAVYYRNYRRIRDRALRRLSKLYPDDYKRFYEEERERDEQEEKVWVDLTGRTNGGTNTAGRPSHRRSNLGSEQTNLHNQPEGNYGGEA